MNEQGQGFRDKGLEVIAFENNIVVASSFDLTIKKFFLICLYSQGFVFLDSLETVLFSAFHSGH